MCERDNTEIIEITIVAKHSKTGMDRRGTVGVDKCIVPLVKALNEAGLTTVASCCGHGKRYGNIALADGREILIMPDFDSARRIDKLFSQMDKEVMVEDC